MAHTERAWHGFRLVALRRDGKYATHSTAVVLRGDDPFIIGRRKEIIHMWVSRVHLIVELATSPSQLCDGCVGYVNVLGHNGTGIDGIYHIQGERVPVRVGSAIELVMDTGIYYRIAYL